MRPDQYSRQQVVDQMRHAGWSELAAEAARTLPDPVNTGQLEAWVVERGVSYNELKSWLAGSPESGGSPRA
jgi:hypothetical protein